MSKKKIFTAVELKLLVIKGNFIHIFSKININYYFYHIYIYTSVEYIYN